MLVVYIEVREGKIKKASLETLSEGKRLADEMNMETAAVFVGSEVDGLASEAFNFGAGKVYVLDNSLFSQYSPSGYTEALFSLIEEIKPEILFMAATAMGKDLAPRLAAKLDVSIASDCTQVKVNNGELEVVRPIFAGKALASFRFKSSPVMATLRPNVFPLAEKTEGTGEVIKKEADVGDAKANDRVAEVIRAEGNELDISEAEIIISGGRGMKGSENFDMLRELSSILPNAAVGSSRSAVDSEWIDHQSQVGQTGKTVSPDLYMAFGISGAIQHLAGMTSSKFIVAVNKDPDAPIFKIADFGVIGDLFKIIPPLKEELKKLVEE